MSLDLLIVDGYDSLKTIVLFGQLIDFVEGCWKFRFQLVIFVLEVFIDFLQMFDLPFIFGVSLLQFLSEIFLFYFELFHKLVKKDDPVFAL